MHEWDDNALLREYVERDSGEAFAALVTRHVNKVYSVALRHTGNASQAEEITQAVFVVLARKSRHLGKRVILSGWLYQTARLTALTQIRSQIRRARREQEAHMQTLANEAESETWNQIAPMLDAAMANLNETDRHAVVLRFFDGKSLREVGAALGANEDAAKKRVSRALEKLRKFFLKRGVASTTVVIAGAITANSVQAAPAELAQTATTIAITKGAAAGGSILTLTKGALKVMAWTKAKMAIVTGAVVLLAAGTTVKVVRAHHTNTFMLTNNQNMVITYQGDEQFRQYMLRVNALSKILDSHTPDRMEKFVAGAWALSRDYPDRQNGYQDIMMAMEDYRFLGQPDQSRALAREFIDSSAPANYKSWAEGFLYRMDNLGKPITLQFTAADGREVDLGQMKGRVVLIDFWQGDEPPQVQAAYAKFHAQGLEVIGVSCNTDKNAFEKYIHENAIAWPQYFDGKQQAKNKLTIRFGIDGIPNMLLVDKNGCLRFDNVRADAEFYNRITRLLAE